MILTLNRIKKLPGLRKLRLGSALLALLLASVILTGCDPVVMLKKTFPEAADSFAKGFIENLRSGDIESAHDRLPEILHGEDAHKQLTDISSQIRKSELQELKLIKFGLVKGLFNKNERSQLTYEFVFEEGYGVANIVVDLKEEVRVVSGIYFESFDRPLAEINRFTLQGKSIHHYIMLFSAIVLPLFVLYTVIHCVVRQGKSGIFWIVVMLLGIGNASINWTSGAVTFNVISMSSIWAPGIRDGLSGAWYITFAFPVGSLAYLYVKMKRRREV